MSGITKAIGSTVGDVFGGLTGASQAADAAEKAANQQYAAQLQALNYLKETNALPNEIRDQALSKLQDIYINGNGQDSLINQAQSSPLYQAIMGSQKSGEDAILRNAAATGGLRSGNANYNLADYNTQLQNNALLQSYNSVLGGLTSLAGTGTNENSIANLISSLGTTQAAGTTASASAQQQGLSNFYNLLGTAAGAYLTGIPITGLGSSLTSGTNAGTSSSYGSNPFGITSIFGLAG